MDSKQMYDQIFCEIFNVSQLDLNDDFSKENVDNWDSIMQLSLVSAIEDEFDLMFEPEEIMGLTSYLNGKIILSKYGIDLNN